METTFTFFTVLYAVIAMLCGLASLLILTFPNSNNPSNKLLGYSYLSFAFVFFFIFYLGTRITLQYPYLDRLSNLFCLLFMPSSYLYLRSMVTKKKLYYRDLIHALPAFLCFIDFVPLFFSPANEKWVMQGEWTILMGLYWVLQIKLLLKFHQKNRIPYPGNHFTGVGQENHRGSNMYISTASLYGYNPPVQTGNSGVSISYIEANRESRYPYPINRNGNILFYQKTDKEPAPSKKEKTHRKEIRGYFKKGWVRFRVRKSGSLEDRPEVMENQAGLKEYSRAPNVVLHESNTDEAILETEIIEKEEKKGIYIPPEQVKKIGLQLSELMAREKPFLRQGYSVKDLAGQLDIHAYQLSAFINLQTGMNFNDFINKLRISYCHEFIREGRASALNLFGLAAKCGFSNRNTFTAAFKKFAGSTPSSFLKTIRDECPYL